MPLIRIQSISIIVYHFKLTPNMALRSGSRNLNGILDTCKRLGIACIDDSLGVVAVTADKLVVDSHTVWDSLEDNCCAISGSYLQIRTINSF